MEGREYLISTTKWIIITEFAVFQKFIYGIESSFQSLNPFFTERMVFKLTLKVLVLVIDSQIQSVPMTDKSTAMPSGAATQNPPSTPLFHFPVAAELFECYEQ